MDIGLFCDTFPFELDGVGVVVKNYAHAFTEAGHICRLVVPKASKGFANETDLPYPLLQYNGLVVPVARQYRAGLPALDFSYNRKQKRVHMDILHAHSPFGAGAEAVRLARLHRAPLVGTFHSKFYDDFYQVTHSETLSHAGVKIILGFFNACDEVWAVNHATADVLRSYGYKKEVVVMPNGTDVWTPTLSDRMYAQVRFHIKSDVPVLLFVGQQHWKKNIRHIMEALAIYKNSRSDFQMVMAGQGPHQGEIEAFVREKGLSEQVLFTGQIMERSALLSLYARADLFLFPSLYDNAAMVVNEAAASGTPSLLIRGSCTAECIQDGVNGFLCEDNPQAIARTVQSALQDQKRLARIGEAARETIPVSWKTTIDRVLARYESLIARHEGKEYKRVRS